MNFSYLNQIEPKLITAHRINKKNCPPPNQSYGERIVKHYELDYIRWGTGHIITNGKKIKAKKGSLFFRTPGMVVEGVSPYHCYYLTFNLFPKDNKKEIKENQLNDTFPEVMGINNIQGIEELFANIYNEYLKQNELTPFITKTYLMDIFLAMYKEWMLNGRFNEGNIIEKEHYNKILAIVNFIEENIEKNFILKELAERCDYSSYHFTRVFKEVTGIPPITFVRKTKINYAKKLLIETNKSVKEIIIDCGFNNQSHFFKLFKKQVACTPSQFRNKHKLW